MFKRVVRSLIAFVAMVASYQAYVLLAVPWMEPPLAHKQMRRATPEDLKWANQAVFKYQRLLSNYFPADHWSQLRPPKVIAGANEQWMFVLDDYQRHEDGGVDVARFAVLIFPTPLRDRIAPPQDVIILEAPQGARLQFDNFRPERGEIGRITRGEFPGPITIRSKMRDAGPEDDLLVEAADLKMNSKLLYGDCPVRFRLGSNVGVGRELEIRFLADEHAQSSDRGFQVPTIDSLEIRRDVRLRMQLETGSLLPGEDKASGSTRSVGELRSHAERGNEAPRPPVEVTCSGPFVFDFIRYRASVDRDVEVREINPNGPSDQVTCNQLDIHFVPKPLPAGQPEALIVDPAKRQQRDIGRLEPAAVVAQGHPVVVTSPARNAEARGGRVQLGLRDRRLVISGGSDVRLVYGPNLLRAPAIEYQHPAADAATRIGRFRATGPGSLDYVFDPAKAEQIFRATWQTSVELGRYQGQPVLTLVGRPQLGVAKMGALEADRVQMYVRELEGKAGTGGGVPLPGEISGDGKLQIVPDRLAATGRVEIESRELTGNAQELLVEFRVEPPPSDGAGAVGRSASVSAGGGSGSVAERFNLAGPSEQPQQAYHIDTDRLQLQVAVRGERMAPTSVSCDGNVFFREIPLAAAAEKPLEVRGGQLTADNLDGDVHVTVLGAEPGQADGSQLAQLAARGVTVLAGAVQLDERENRLWIEGPGKANMVVAKEGVGSLFRQRERVGTVLRQESLQAEQSRQSQHRPDPGAAATSFPLDITWQGGLNFDGKFVVLDRDVVVQGADDWVRCDGLTARLTTPVKFGEQIDQKSVDLAEVECRGQVVLDHRSRDELGLASHARMNLARLTINQQTGAIGGDGPGAIRSTHFSDQLSALAGPAAGGKPNQVSPPPGVRGGKLHFLRVDFQGLLSGNLYTRELRFQDRVRAVYGPVDAWEQELDGSRPDVLPQDSMALSCDDLALNEDPLAVRGATSPYDLGSRPLGPVQMRAQGNVQIDGQSAAQGTFGARADSASYEQAKDVLLLKGTTRAPAQVWQRRGPGDNSPPYTAQTIRYVRATGEVSGKGIQYLEYVPTATPQRSVGPAPQNARGPAGPLPR